jgi:hypothetical protein
MLFLSLLILVVIVLAIVTLADWKDGDEDEDPSHWN